MTDAEIVDRFRSLENRVAELETKTKIHFDCVVLIKDFLKIQVPALAKTIFERT